MKSCSDVCEYISEVLLTLGFELDMDDEEHEDMLIALEHVTIVRDNEE